MSEINKKDKWYHCFQRYFRLFRQGNENTFMYAGITVCVVAVITPFLILLFTKDINFTTLGTVGDFFGGTTVGLFNLASILLVLATVKMQSIELKETRVEFETTNKTLIKQQFDNTFFNMINLHNEIVSSLHISDHQGKYALSYLNSQIKSYYRSVQLDDKRARIVRSYESFYAKYYFGHYFRNMYRILKFIDETEELSVSEKKNYIGILRAQLSTGELLLIFYNALSVRGIKFKKLILKYNFFDDLLDDDDFYKVHKHYLLK
ncbi:putative phage abortive infection protein [Bacillus subtilis]|uniref:putative phage abortive infection protein n=1 Tax=Bacillus subtilis TaxID=1423 RepID=UPI00404634CE